MVVCAKTVRLSISLLVSLVLKDSAPEGRPGMCVCAACVWGSSDQCWVTIAGGLALTALLSGQSRSESWPDNWCGRHFANVRPPLRFLPPQLPTTVCPLVCPIVKYSYFQFIKRFVKLFDSIYEQVFSFSGKTNRKCYFAWSSVSISMLEISHI